MSELVIEDKLESESGLVSKSDLVSQSVTECVSDGVSARCTVKEKNRVIMMESVSH